jgi:hypothetical protein
VPLDLARLKKSFFDQKAVKDALDPAVRKALSRFGAFVRTRARSSIRPGGKSGKTKGGKAKTTKTSKPGQPPYSHQGDIKRILFGYDVAAKSVVIGPVVYGSKSGAPENLEHGGYARLKGGRRVLVKPRPFMQPAFESELAKVGNNFRNLIK